MDENLRKYERKDVLDKAKEAIAGLWTILNNPNNPRLALLPDLSKAGKKDSDKEPGFREEAPVDPIKAQFAAHLAGLKGVLNNAKLSWGPLGPPDGTEALKEGIGVGDLTMGRFPEELDLQAYGHSPWISSDDKAGTGDRLPQLKPGRKEGVADVVGMLPVGPAELKGAVAGAGELGAALAGQVRKKGDVITPELAKKFADRLFMDPRSGNDLDIPPIVKEKAAKYFQSVGGTESDPLKKIPLWGPPKERFYPNAMERGVPLVPTDIEGTASAADFRTRLRPDMEMPSESVAAAGVDDMIGQALNSGERLTTSIRTLKPGLEMGPDELRGVNEMVAAATGRNPNINSDLIQNAYNDKIYQLSEGSGIWQENLPKVIDALPEGNIIGSAQNPTTGAAERQMRSGFASKVFKDYIDSIPDDKLAGMKFEQIAEGFHKHNEQAFREWGKTARGPVLMDSLTAPGAEWQKLDNEKALLFQGIDSDICVGQENYVRDALNGDQVIWGLRDKNTQKPLLTINAHVDRGSAVPPEMPRMDELGRQLKARLALMNPQEKEEAAAQIGRWYGLAVGRTDYGPGLARSFMSPNTEYRISDYLRLFTDNGTARSIGRDEGRLAAAGELFRFAGMELPPEYGKGTQSLRIDQVKGRKNAVDTIPPELKQEAAAFIAKLEEQGVSTSGSNDWRRIRDSLAGSAGERTPSGMTEADLEYIQSLYEPRGQYGVNAYGRKWYVDPNNNRAMTVDKGTTLVTDSVDPTVDSTFGKYGIHLGDLVPSEEHSKVRTETARAVKGATSPHESIQGEIAALMQKKEEARLAAERLMAEMKPGRRDGSSMVYLQHGNKAYWNDFGDLMVGDIGPQGEILNRAYVQQAEIPAAQRRQMVAKLEELNRLPRAQRNELPIMRNQEVARVENWHPNVAADHDIQDRIQQLLDPNIGEWREVNGPDGQVRVIFDAHEVDGHAYWRDEDGGLMAAPMFNDGLPDWDNVYGVDEMVDVQDFPDYGRAIRQRFRQHDEGNMAEVADDIQANRAAQINPNEIADIQHLPVGWMQDPVQNAQTPYIDIGNLRFFIEMAGGDVAEDEAGRLVIMEMQHGHPNWEDAMYADDNPRGLIQATRNAIQQRLLDQVNAPD